MKRKVYFVGGLILIIFAAILFNVSYQKGFGISEYLDTIERELFPERFIDSRHYGVTPLGTFFIHTKMVDSTKNVLLILLAKEDDLVLEKNCDSLRLSEEGKSEIILRMRRVGDYFIVTPSQEFDYREFYFETSNRVITRRRE